MPDKCERKKKMSCTSGSSVLEGNLNREGEETTTKQVSQAVAVEVTTQ